jgi:hypothetical protein
VIGLDHMRVEFSDAGEVIPLPIIRWARSRKWIGACKTHSHGRGAPRNIVRS